MDFKKIVKGKNSLKLPLEHAIASRKLGLGQGKQPSSTVSAEERRRSDPQLGGTVYVVGRWERKPGILLWELIIG